MKFKLQSVLYIDPKEQPENISVLLKGVHIPPIVQGYADRQEKLRKASDSHASTRRDQKRTEGLFFE